MKKALLLTISLLLVTIGGVRAGDWSFSGKSPAPLAGPITPENCLSYDYINVGYGIDSFDTPYMYDGDFWSVGFSKSLGSAFFLTGSYSSGSHDFYQLCGCGEVGVDTHRYRMGLGARKHLTSCIDLTFEGGFDHVDARFDAKPWYNHDSWGYYFGPGIRARAGRFEMFAKALYTGREGDYEQELLRNQTNAGLGSSWNGWLFCPGVLYHLTDSVALEVSAEISTLDSAVLFGARYMF